MTARLKAILYARFSPRPRDRVEESESIETQFDYCRRWCKKHDYEIVGEFSDQEWSGDDEERPGLWQAIDALRRGYVLVCFRRDRLAKGVYLDEYLSREVAKKQARIEATEGSPNGTEPHDQMVRQILASVAENENRVIAIRTRLAMLRHQASGRKMSYAAPYGWRIDMAGPLNKRGLPARLVADEVEQRVIQKIVAERQNGMGLREIARLLNDLNVPSRGRQWYHVTVGAVLRRAEVAAASSPVATVVG